MGLPATPLYSLDGLRYKATINGLNFLFLAELIIVVIIALFFAFYVYRLSINVFFLPPIRLYLWYYHHVDLQIDSFDFSVMNGRIGFKQVRYTGTNQAVRILKVSIVWRYWLWRVRTMDDVQKENCELPCRIEVNVEGVEWFLYNKSAAFDTVLAKHLFKTTTTTNVEESIMLPATDSSVGWRLALLPVSVQVTKGSIVLGNVSTPTLLICGFEKAQGTVGTVQSRSKYDYFKQVYHFRFEQPRIVFRTNPDFAKPMNEYAKQVDEDCGLIREDLYRSLESKSYRALLKKKLPKFGLFGKFLAQSYKSAQPKFPPGLDKSKEYGRLFTVYDQGSIDFTYYVDSAGPVPSLEKPQVDIGKSESYDIGNGDLAPEWGCDIKVNGGTFTYGPWADRHRATLQKAFAPSMFTDHQADAMLLPGQQRKHLALKIFVEITQHTQVRLTTRQSSKEWNHPIGETPYGWFAISISPNSVITYLMPNIATCSGYESLVNVHLDAIRVATPENRNFIDASSCRISGHLPAPLQWNAHRMWQFAINLSHSNIYILRENGNMIADIIKDWTSGPATDFDAFIPTSYSFNVTLSDFMFQLFTNKFNVISHFGEKTERPLSPQFGILPPLVPAGGSEADEEKSPNNRYRIESHRLVANIEVSGEDYQAPFTTVDVHIECDEIRHSFLAPLSHTTRSYSRKYPGHDFGIMSSLNVDMQYGYTTNGSAEPVEILQIDASVPAIKLKTIGWIMDSLMNLKDNYFGDFTKLRFFEKFTSEFRDIRRHHNDPKQSFRKPHIKAEAIPLEVCLNLVLEDTFLFVPEDFYDCTSAIAIHIPGTQVSLRNNDYFMELMVALDTLRVSPVQDASILAHFTINHLSSYILSVDGVVISGHRLFGEPPVLPTYVSVWDFDVKHVHSALNAETCTMLTRTASNLLSTFTNIENNPSTELYSLESYSDCTVVHLRLQSCQIVYTVSDSSTLELHFPAGVVLKTNDLAGNRYYQHIYLIVPSISANAQSATVIQRLENVLVVDCGLKLAYGVVEPEFTRKVCSQQEFVKRHDSETRRCPFLYEAAHSQSSNVHGFHLPKLAAPASKPTLSFQELLTDHQDIVSMRDELSQMMPFHKVSLREKHIHVRLTKSLQAKTSLMAIKLAEKALSELPQEDDIFRRLDNLLRGRLQVINSFKEPLTITRVVTSISTARFHYTHDHTHSYPLLLLNSSALQMGVSFRQEYEYADTTPCKHSLPAALPLDKSEDLNVESTVYPEAKEPTLKKIPRLQKLVSSHVLFKNLDLVIYRQQSPDFRVLRLLGSSSSANMIENPTTTNVQVDIGEWTLEFSQEASEEVAEAAWQVLSHIKGLLAFLAYTKDQAIAQDRAIVKAIMQVDNEYAGATQAPAYENTKSGLQSPIWNDCDWFSIAKLRNVAYQAKSQIQDRLRELLLQHVTLMSDLQAADLSNYLSIQETDIVKSTTFKHLLSCDKTPSKNSLQNANVSLYWKRLTARHLAPVPDQCVLEKAAFSLVQRSFNTSHFLALMIDVELLRLRVSPALIPLMRHIISVRKAYEAKFITLEHQTKISTSTSPHSSAITYEVQPSVRIARIDTTGSVRPIELGLSINNFTAGASFKFSKGARMIVLHGFLEMDGAGIYATEVRSVKDTLGTVNVSKTRASVGLLDQQAGMRCVLEMGLVEAAVPRSLLRLHEFIRAWKHVDLPQSMALLETLRQDLKSIEASPTNEINVQQIQSFGSIHVNAVVAAVTVSLRTSPSLWVHYTLGEINSYFNRESANLLDWAAGVRIGYQSLRFQPTQAHDHTRLSTTTHLTAIPIPGLSLTSTRNAQGHQIACILETVQMAVTIDVVDHVLAIFERLDQEVDELIAMRAQAKGVGLSRGGPSSSKIAGKYSAHVQVRGVHLTLESPTCIQYLDAEGVSASFSNNEQLAWSIETNALALSLARREPIFHRGALGQEFRIAYFTIDLGVTNEPQDIVELIALDTMETELQLHISVNRVQAVMQTAAVEVLDDLVDYFVDQVKAKSKARANEIAAIKARFDSFESTSLPSSESPPWIERCTFTFRSQSMGIAFPLAQTAIEHPAPRSKSITSRPAFLVSLSSIVFGTQKGSQGLAEVRSLAVTYIENFDQNKKEHFDGISQPSQNRLALPHVHLILQPSLQNPDQATRLVKLDADISGLELEMDSTVISAIFTMLDLYTISKQRFGKLATVPMPRLTRSLTAASTTKIPNIEHKLPIVEDRISTKELSVMATISLGPGRIVIFPFSSRNLQDRKKTTDFNRVTRKPEEFVVPGVSISAEYRKYVHQSSSSKALVISNTVHASKNVITPRIIPFIADIKSIFSQRARAPVADIVGVIEPVTSPKSIDTPALIAIPFLPSTVSKSMKIHFDLQIEKSELTITAGESMRVEMELKWGGGGCLITVLPETRGVHIAVNVGDVVSDLKHSFSSESCLRATVGGMIATITFQRNASIVASNNLSMMWSIQPIHGNFSIDQLQDLLVFKHVWVDSFPVHNADIPLVPTLTSNIENGDINSNGSSLGIHQPASSLVVVVAFHVQSINMILKLTSSFGNVQINVVRLLTRLHASEDTKEGSISFESAHASGQSHLAGAFHLEKTVVETILQRAKSKGEEADEPRLRVNLRIGASSTELNLQYRRVLLIKADPVDVMVFDDWTAAESGQLKLNYHVTLRTFNLILISQIIPTLVRFGTELDVSIKEKISRARQEFSLRPSNIKRLSTASSHLVKHISIAGSPSQDAVCTSNQIKFEAARIRLAVYRKHFTDAEAYRADIGKVEALLDTQQDLDQVVRREVRLDLEFCALRKITPARLLSSSKEHDVTIMQWFELLNDDIPGASQDAMRLPQMFCRMQTEQLLGSNELKYWIKLHYGGRLQVSLNYLLLKEITKLVQTIIASTKRMAENSPSTQMSNLAPVDALPIELSASAEKPVLSFIKVEEDIQDVQTENLGSMTPSLALLGINKKEIPVHLHTFVTLPLEDLVSMLGSFYSKRLESNKPKRSKTED